VLFEIEELAKGFENCTVEASRCLGACRKAPNAEVVRGQAEGICTRISDAERSAAVVARATGAMPCFEDPRLARKLADARMRRVRSRARAEGKWNAALAGFPEQVMSRSGRERLELQLEMSQLMASAGLWEEALSHVAEVEARSGDSLAVAMERARLLGRLGRSEELEAIQRRVSAMRLDRRLAKEVASSLRNCVADCATAPGLDGARRPIEKYGLWYLEGTTKVSRHSAIYHFRSEDEARGTPLPKKRKRGAQHSTWHTTLLAGVGANSEGPLPWVERDYTPVSTAAEWEQGKCDILIKIYRDGLATSWLHRQDPGCSVRLSQPMKTLDVPSLVTDRHQATFEPASVLLLLAGTGIVVGSQILRFAGPGDSRVLPQPVSLLYSCRSDDVLLAEELRGWCASGRLRRCTLLLTEPDARARAPFPEAEGADLARLARTENVQCVRSRLSRALLETELGHLGGPIRCVVSGPAAFNAAAGSMLHQAGVAADAVTILNA